MSIWRFVPAPPVGRRRARRWSAARSTSPSACSSARSAAKSAAWWARRCSARRSWASCAPATRSCAARSPPSAPRGGRSGYVDRALDAHGLTRRVQVLTPSYMTAPWLLLGTDLVLTLARRTAKALAGTLPLALFEPPLAIEGFVVAARWHERQAKDAGHRWFRRLLSDAAKDV
jgi:DNA-binding transcriptional LysR family regulator